MDVSTPPILDLACPQAETEIEKYVHMFRDRGVDKNKNMDMRAHDHSNNSNIYGFCHMISYVQVISNSQSQVWFINFIGN